MYKWILKEKAKNAKYSISGNNYAHNALKAMKAKWPDMDIEEVYLQRPLDFYNTMKHLYGGKETIYENGEPLRGSGGGG